MGGESKHFQMEINFKEIILKDFLKEKEHMPGKMEQFIKVIFQKEFVQELEFFLMKEVFT